MLFWVIGVILFALIVPPLLFIWCINTLFGTVILLSFKTWFAALLLLILLASGHSSSERTS